MKWITFIEQILPIAATMLPGGGIAALVLKLATNGITIVHQDIDLANRIKADLEKIVDASGNKVFRVSIAEIIDTGLSTADQIVTNGEAWLANLPKAAPAVPPVNPLLGSGR